MGLKKDAQIQLSISAGDLNTILDALSKMPYKEVYHIIAEIHQQVKSQTDSIKTGNNS